MHPKKKKTKFNDRVHRNPFSFHSLRAFWLSTLILFRTMHRENEVFSYFMCFSNTSFCLHLSIVTKWEPVRCSHTWWCSIFGWSFFCVLFAYLFLVVHVRIGVNRPDSWEQASILYNATRDQHEQMIEICSNFILKIKTQEKGISILIFETTLMMICFFSLLPLIIGRIAVKMIISLLLVLSSFHICYLLDLTVFTFLCYFALAFV